MAHEDNSTAIVRLRQACLPPVRHWMEIDEHVEAFSITANVLLPDCDGVTLPLRSALA